MLEEIAVNNWAEYFIGIGKDQTEVSKAKLRFADLDPPNASVIFLGRYSQIIPNIQIDPLTIFYWFYPKSIFPEA